MLPGRVACAHKADIGSNLARCEIENSAHFCPGRTNSNQLNFVQHIAGAKPCPHNRTCSLERSVRRRKTVSETGTATCFPNMSLPRPLVRADL